jgi:phage-related protein
MKTLTAGVIAETQKAHGTTAWPWLVYIVASQSVTATEVFRLTNHPQPITIDAKTYDPYPFALGVRSSDSEGNIPSVQLSVSNIDRQIVRNLATADNLLGKTCTLRQVNTANLSSAAWLETTLTIAGAVVTRAAIEFRLELPNPHDIQLPQEVFLRDRCPWRFGSSECGFVITSTSSTDCDKLLTTCTTRGLEELTAGRPQLHPLRFGGWPGLPRKVRA